MPVLRRAWIVAVAAAWLVPGTARAGDVAVGGGLGLSVPAHGSNGTDGMGVLLVADYELVRRGLLVGKAHAGAIWTMTRPNTCVAGGAPCNVSARALFAGAEARLDLGLSYLALGLGVGAGAISTRFADSDTVARGLAPHVLIGFGLGFLSLQYLYFPTANHLTGGVAVTFRVP